MQLALSHTLEIALILSVILSAADSLLWTMIANDCICCSNVIVGAQQTSTCEQPCTTVPAHVNSCPEPGPGLAAPSVCAEDPEAAK